MSVRPVSRRRRLAALASGALVAGLVPLVATSAPASAEPGCLRDDSLAFLVDMEGCDDDTPPDTVVTKIAPAPGEGGYVRGKEVTYTFMAVASDGDTGPWTYMCRLDGAQAGTFQACGARESTTPQSITYKDLADLRGDGYRFQVYAVDVPDAATTWSDASNPLSPPVGETAPDDDRATPAAAAPVRVDTAAPNTFILDEPFDEIRPEFPMVLSRTISVRLESSERQSGERLTYACELNDVKVPCGQGTTELKGLTPGNKTFTAVATDLGGNRDATPAKIVFAVPRDLNATKGSGWRTAKEGGYYAGDFLEARRLGATITTKPVQVRELRLIAPAGPNLGSVAIRIGRGKAKIVKLTAPTYTKMKVYVLRDEFSQLVSGPISVTAHALGTNQVVRVDAILANPVSGR